MNNYRYSFIIPHKDIPVLLDRCITSIPVSHEIQIIIVDDNSYLRKEVVDLQNKYKHATFVYLDKTRGAGYARNEGLKYADGDWIIFADADDFFCEGILNLLDSHFYDKEDIVYFNAKSVYSQTLTHSPKLDKREKALKRYANLHRKINEYCRYLYTEPWGKMIKASIIKDKNIIFDETPVANDFFFSVCVGFYAAEIVFDPAILYVYTEREGSLSYKVCPNEKVLKTRLEVYKKVQDFMDKNHIPYNPFYRFSVSEYLKPSPNYSSYIKAFWKLNGLSLSYVIFRYIKGKIYQYTFGVHN